jgi:hypothetical protein
MSMPGFTAMLSLERTTYTYVSGKAGMVTQRVTGVVPSAVLPYRPLCWEPCFYDNYSGICVCPPGTGGYTPPWPPLWLAY